VSVLAFIRDHIGSALRLSFAMFWQVLWPLALGFLLSAVVETLVSKQAVSRPARPRHAEVHCVGDGVRRSVLLCSYAAVAVARTLFRKGRRSAMP